MAEQKANAEKGDGIAVFAEEGVGVLFGDRAGKMVGKTVGAAVDISDKAVGGTLGAVGLRDRGDIEARGSAASRSAGGATPPPRPRSSPGSVLNVGRMRSQYWEQTCTRTLWQRAQAQTISRWLAPPCRHCDATTQNRICACQAKWPWDQEADAVGVLGCRRREPRAARARRTARSPSRSRKQSREQPDRRGVKPPPWPVLAREMFQGGMDVIGLTRHAEPKRIRARGRRH